VSAEREVCLLLTETLDELRAVLVQVQGEGIAKRVIPPALCNQRRSVHCLTRTNKRKTCGRVG
jgi:hypothetical protein